MSGLIQTLGALSVGSAQDVAKVNIAQQGPAQAGSDFASVLKNLAVQTVESVQAGEAASVAGIEGRMETREVVDAIMTAEHSLQTAIAVRDKIVSAYLDMSRMQI